MGNAVRLGGVLFRPGKLMRRKPEITGKTSILPMIGHPIAQVQTPGPMNQWFEDNGVDSVITPMDIRPERVKEFFAVIKVIENCLGCSVTMPHKQAAFAASDEVSERARHAKSVNVIRRLPSGRLVGDMTDGIAMVSALESNGIKIAGCNVILIGAGGAGTAIAFEIADKNAASLTILEIDKMRQRALISALSQHYPDMPVFDSVRSEQKFQIAINASPLGMQTDDALPIPLEQLEGALIVADAVTKPAITPWLMEARERGISIQSGKDMALAQVSIQLEFWRFKSTSNSSTPKARVVVKRGTG